MSILTIIGQHSAEFLMVLAGLMLVLLAFVISSQVRMSRLTARYRKLMVKSDQVDMETLMAEYARLAQQLDVRLGTLEQNYQSLRMDCQLHVQRLLLSRYNAFENTGSDLSFSLALLDEAGDGVVLTSIFGRDESRLYAKPVVQGKSTYALSKEETDTIKQALTPRKR